MKLIKIITISVIIIGIILSIFYFTFELILIENQEEKLNNNEHEMIELSGSLFTILVNPDDLAIVNGKTIPLKASFALKNELEQVYKQIKVSHDEKSLVIIPTFTASAYAKNGFYDFFNKNCDDQCLTVEILSKEKLDYSSSANSVKILQLLGYDSITDLELHKNPDILNGYDKIIILHNEYVSKIMFDAITSHNNVIFLYPNSLYGEVKVDNINNEITLIRGHGYPSLDITNGFNWENENTQPYEFDNKCENWEFYPISNGHMLNCFPENIIWKNELLLKTIKDL